MGGRHTPASIGHPSGLEKKIMKTPVSVKYIYSDLTWPEVNEAVRMNKVILLPIDMTEQHGPHFPLDVDNLIAEFPM